MVSLGLVGGIAISLQSFANGQLGEHLGSPELAGVVNSFVGVSGLLALGYLTGAIGRARRRMAPGVRPRSWHLAAAAAGGANLLLLTHAAPRIGIAMLTVAFVCGQVTGGLAVDHFALSTAGRHSLTAPRLLAALIAITAVAIAGIGSEAELHAGLLALVILGGATVAVVSVSLSQMAQMTGEPLVAAVINSVVSGTVLVIAALMVTRGSPPNGWQAPPGYWIAGGLCSVLLVTAIAAAVKSLGVLRLTLLLVAGQSIGALLLDLIAPPKDAPITVATLISLLLVFAAVVISNRNQLGRNPRAPTADVPALNRDPVAREPEAAQDCPR
jgi:bacterial/archaeal transporter family-2 protein